MTTSADGWLDDLVDEGVVAAPGRPNATARDSLMTAARTSLDDATRDAERSPGGIIRDTENAVRQAVTALAAHHGTRIVGPNRHVAVVRFADARPGFDDATVDRIDQIRVARNAGMYGDRYDDAPVVYSAADAEHLVRVGTGVVNRVASVINVGRLIPPPPSAG